MDAPDVIENEPGRFFDGGTDAEPTRTLPAAAYELTRVIASVNDEPEREWFQLRRRVGYQDRHHGELLVPLDCSAFYSDLTSVPALFTWLVPKSGDHLPAALIHDGLVRSAGKPQEHIGDDVTRVEADRVFRDAMADSGTGVIRRWIVWAAVTLATIWEQQDTATSRWARAYYRWIMAVSLFSIGWLGYEATADLANRSGQWPCTYELFWIVGDHWWVQLLTGAAGAVLIPIGISVLWWRFWRAGAIAGVLLGALFHVSIALLVLSGIYLVLEAGVTNGATGLRALLTKLVLRWRGVVTLAFGAAALVIVCVVAG